MGDRSSVVCTRAGGPAIALLLGLASGCRDDPAPATGTETEGSDASEGSSADGLDSTGTPPGTCVPGQARPCYDGPPGTEGVGLCAAGQQVCAEGQGWSECTGQVWPQADERCDTPGDDDCDGWSVCEAGLEWVQSIPGTVYHVATNPAGHVIVVGTGGSGVFQDQVVSDTFVLDLDPGGTLQWVRNIPGGGLLTPYGVAVDGRGAITIVGHYDGAPDLGGGPLPPAAGGDAFAVRYGPDGTHLWDHAATPDGYYAVAVGPDDTTYVVGGTVVQDDGREPTVASFFVEAIDPTGERAWLTTGQGGFGLWPEGASIAVTETGEVAVALGLSGFDLALGGLPLEVEGIQVVVVRMAPDGTPLGYDALPQPAPVSVDRVQIVARPGGLMMVASVVELGEVGGYDWQAMLVGLDAGFAPIGEHRVGQDVRLRSAAAHPDGTTVLNLEFEGLLELGSVGVGVPSYQLTPAIAVVDDEGQARWVEVLYTDSFVDVPTVAAAPDGAVVLAGFAFGDGAVLVDQRVLGPFVAKLRP